MRKLIEQAGQTLAEFQEQRDFLVQLVQINDAYAPVLLQMLSDLDQENDSDISILAPTDFESPEQFATALVAQTEAELEYIKGAAEAEEQELPFEPPQLKPLYREELTPEERIREVLALIKGLMPKEPGHRLIFGMFPLNISDEEIFATFCSSLIGDGPRDPLWRGTRVVIRLPDPAGESWQPIATQPYSQHDSFDFSQQAIEQSYKDEAADEDLPQEQRIQALYSDAIFDLGYNRNEEARTKLDTVLAHYQATENSTMQAVVMNTLGDLYRHRLDDIAEAEHWYSCATLPGAESAVPVILLPIVRNLGELAMETGRLDESAEFFEHAEQLARRVPDPGSTAEILNLRGLNSEQQGENEEAAEHWRGAITLADSFEIEGVKERMEENLNRIGAA